MEDHYFAQKSGVGQYLYRLYDALFRLDDDNVYYIYSFLFLGKKLNKPFKKNYKNVYYRMVRYLPSKAYNAISRNLFVPPADIMTGIKPDIAIFGSFIRSPMPLGATTITFVYDISYMSHADKASTKNSRILLKRVPRSVKKSDIIVTISENSKQEIIKSYNIDNNKIIVINPAIDHTEYYPRKAEEINRVKKKYDIGSCYILYAGTIEPRKNIIGILDAYEKLPDGLREEYVLVLAGGKGWKDEEILARLAKLANLNIVVTGYVADEDLPLLYSGASLFVFPSFYEGWGMPPLEAMACGTPVITSDNSSLPEVVGNAGIMVNAQDTNELSKQITRVLSDKKLARELVRKGHVQAARFSWDKSAKELQRLIQSLRSD